MAKSTIDEKNGLVPQFTAVKVEKDDSSEYEYVIQTGCFPDTPRGRCCKKNFMFFSYCIFGFFFLAFFYLLYRFKQSFNMMVEQNSLSNEYH